MTPLPMPIISNGHYGNASYQCGIKKIKIKTSSILLFYTYMHTQNYIVTSIQAQLHPYTQIWNKFLLKQTVRPIQGQKRICTY